MKSQLNPREGEEREEQRPKWTHRKNTNIHGKRTKPKVTSLRSKALTNLWAERSRKKKERHAFLISCIRQVQIIQIL